jgi:hypothetical protein
LAKYNNSNLLIVGGGTSTLDVKWENIPYDYLWTCNDFYLEDRVLSKNIDLYVPARTTKFKNNLKLENKLKGSSTTILVEPGHFYVNSGTFNAFLKKIEKSFVKQNLFEITKKESPAAYSGVGFRLIMFALEQEFSKIYFVGFDGFNKEFSNVHAFTKHPGLKDSDKRRSYDNGPVSYVNVFTEAYNILAKHKNSYKLQNLGEGLTYNIGTTISKKYFPLTQETKKLIYEF